MRVGKVGKPEVEVEVDADMSRRNWRRRRGGGRGGQLVEEEEEEEAAAGKRSDKI